MIVASHGYSGSGPQQPQQTTTQQQQQQQPPQPHHSPPNHNGPINTIQVQQKQVYMPTLSPSQQQLAQQQQQAAAAAAQQQQQHHDAYLMPNPHQRLKNPNNLAISIPLNSAQQLAHKQQQQLLQQQQLQLQQQQHAAMLQHPPQPGSPLREQSLSGSYYSDDGGGPVGPGGMHPNGLHDCDDDEDDSSSDDESPRENRVLTFADEHGKNLCHVHWYEPDPGEDHRAVPMAALQAAQGKNDHDIDSSLENAGCGGKCVIL